MKVKKEGNYKFLSSENANYIFDMKNGFTVSWGKTIEDDPMKFPGPVILDCEVTTKCTGINGKVCQFCYKANTPNGKNMSFETFKHILDVIPETLTQVAFGADSTLKSNPDLWRMMEYCREKDIVPNITAAQIDDETADKLAKYCGAVSISRYDNKDVCYDSIKRLTDRGMKQVNMHFMIAEETYEQALETINDIKTDERLSKLNALVFLSLKKKGRASDNNYHCLSQEKFNNLIKEAGNDISLGFDTCSAQKALNALGDGVKGYVDRCESTLQSAYISLEGKYYPCSFCEGEGDWKEGLDVLAVNSPEEFIENIWNNPKTEKFRNKLSSLVYECHKSCPVYNI